MKRYQDCIWYERIWRRRYYLLIPFEALNIWLTPQDPGWELSFRNSWDIALGLAQCAMNWTYDMEDVFNEKDN